MNNGSLKEARTKSSAKRKGTMLPATTDTDIPPAPTVMPGESQLLLSVAESSANLKASSSRKRKGMETEARERKRKKAVVDPNRTFEIVQAAMLHPIPPMIHTPHSLMSMLLKAFELEFPDVLTHQTVGQMLRELNDISP
jgi:hypothetical protein